MILEQNERARFAAYLREDAESNRLLVEQLKMIGPPALVDLKYKQIAACLIVAEMLDATEDF